ncbi:phosphomannomutase [Halorhabdus sp. BNX81]|uniref:phosphomannomutase n=1 Tax=Halorhabdus sp. BNX81 TaxID=2980181 RepID=UPI0023DCFB40|nr:phosphomannomutase [Halorhabdus sp. BNX81]WEL21849.1 Phosphomannomutase [Halorhabdus sp. BNX81]
MDLFGTAGIRGPVSERVTPDLALRVGRAAGDDGAEFVVGRDGRTTGMGLAAAVEAGLESAGADVIRVGQIPTPTLAYASRGRRGVILTASHNPPADNGLKLFVDGQQYPAGAESRIESRIEDDPAPAPWDEWGTTTRRDPLPDYRKAVVEYAETLGAPLDGLGVAVDCGNGVAGVATPPVLRMLGAHVRALDANVDGHFPARESKPTPENIRGLRQFVAGSEAVEIGFAHDGDGDRIVVVDDDGDVIHEDTVTAILADHFVRESSAGDPVVITTPNTSTRIDERVQAAGGRVERVALGSLHEGLADIPDTPETEVVLASEPWKYIFPDLGPWMDAIASAGVFARLVAESGLDALRAPVTERPFRKVNVDCPDADKPAVMDRLAAELPAQFASATASTDYGVRLEFPDDSWALVRPSGTEPYIRLYAESDEVETLIDDVRAGIEDAVEAAT